MAAQLAFGALLVASVTPLVAVLRSPVGVADPSMLYLVAVVAVAVTAGVLPAMATAAMAMLAYDLLFVEPRFTFDVADPSELLDLLMLLLVGAVVGQLAGLQRRRARAAEVRERESRALFAINRALAAGPSADAAIPEMLKVVCHEASMDRAWVALDEESATGRVLADSGAGAPSSSPTRTSC